MSRLGTIDERFQAYDVEMVEVASGSQAPAGMNPDLFQYRPRIDLTNARLRKLPTGLGPSCVRVSGTWANTTYFADSDRAPSARPKASVECGAAPSGRGPF